MSKTIYSGLEGSGKSLKLAMVAVDLAHRNSKWAQSSGVVRPIASNLQFSENFTRYVTQDLGIPIIYWENLDDLIELEQCDVLIDEVGNYFDSRGWQELTLDARRWLTQGSKMGIELYGTAQDFAQVDKSFRRLVNNLIHIRKMVGNPRPSATRPPIKFIWGACMSLELDPQTYNEDKSKFETLNIFSFRMFFIRKEFCEIFDTTQKIKKSAPPKLKHIERFCEFHDIPNGACTFHKTVHT